jgi:hypothetical protein
VTGGRLPHPDSHQTCYNRGALPKRLLLALRASLQSKFQRPCKMLNLSPPGPSIHPGIFRLPISTSLSLSLSVWLLSQLSLLPSLQERSARLCLALASPSYSLGSGLTEIPWLRPDAGCLSSHSPTPVTSWHGLRLPLHCGTHPFTRPPRFLSSAMTLVPPTDSITYLSSNPAATLPIIPEG